MATKTKSKPLTPREARRFEQICKLPRDNVNCGVFWMMLDGGVVITQKRSGEPATAQITIPRRTFDKFVDWYQTGKAP